MSTSHPPSGGPADSVLDTSDALGDSPDVDIPPLRPSDLDDEDYPDEDIPPPDPFN